MTAMTATTTAAADDLLYEVQGGVGRITFNRPQARNALTFAMYERLAEICEAANTDRALKVLILTGAGDKAFAAGTDINQFRAFKTPQDAIEYESRMDRVLGTLEACRVPTIAAITGACTGGGAGIAACCDLRIGTTTSKFGLPVARTLGNCLSMSNLSRFAALIGPARVKDIIFTARLIEARGGGPDRAAQRGGRRRGGPAAPGRRARAPDRRPRAADHARHQGGAAPPAPAPFQRGGRGPDPDVLHEPRLPRGHGRLPQQAHAAMGG